MEDDPDQQADQLRRLLSRSTSELTDEELITAARALAELHKAGPERIGRILAELYSRNRLSWPKIAELVGMPMTTIYTWTRPFLPPDEGDERTPRQGQSTDT